MTVFRVIVMAAIAALIGVFGVSYANNPNMPVTAHASAVGFTMANALSAQAWQGLACPHRAVVTDLVTKSMGPKLCGTPTDGGAAQRAKRFQTEGPVSCWALYDALSQKTTQRFASVIAGKEPAGPAADDVCRQAKRLIGG